MANDLGRRDSADAGAVGQAAALGETVEEAAREQVARAGGIDDARDWLGGNDDLLPARDNDGAFFRPGNDGDRGMRRQLGHRRAQVGRLVQAEHLCLVAEHHVDVPGEQITEVGAVPLDTEYV